MGIAFFAGGCFWGVEAAFQQVPGVTRTCAGFMGGDTESPTYQEVCSDTTGHAETVAVEYDETRVSYHALLEIFFSSHDPTQLNRQGSDVGTQYRSVIFSIDQDQKTQAEIFILDLEQSGRYTDPIVTEVIPAVKFWPAEDYHQSYYIKMGRRYGDGSW